MQPIISIQHLSKTYAPRNAAGQPFQALKDVSLEIRKGEIFALLGPNGAGKTTLISIICGIVTPTSGTVLADGFDIQKQFRQARDRIGLVARSSTSFAKSWFGEDYGHWLPPADEVSIATECQIPAGGPGRQD